VIAMKKAIAAFLLLAACGPMTLAEAERQCVDRALLAKQPRGTVSFGVGSGGKATTELDVTVSSDFLLGRDPSAVFDSCVMAKAGELPSRPLMQQPGWR
jgi:hypothetical protein